MSDLRAIRLSVGLVLIVLALVGCNLPPFGPLGTDEPETESVINPTVEETGAPSITTSQNPTESILNEQTTSVSPTADPPTRPPPDIGETMRLTRLSPGTELTIVNIEMIDFELGWALGGTDTEPGRVLRTSDGGLRWREVTPPIRQSLSADDFQVAAQFLDDQNAQVLRYHPLDRQAETGTSILVVWRTQDGGASWQASEPLRVPFIAVDRVEPYWDYGTRQAGWILARRGGVGMHQHPVALLRTVDAGASWTLQHGPFDSPEVGLTGCTKSGMDFGSGAVGLLTISDCPIDGAELISTEDGGDRWQSQQLPAPAGYEEQYAAAAGGGCQSHSPHVLTESSWRVAVLCRVFDEQENRYSFLYSSNDGGVSWGALAAPEGELTFLSPEQGWALGRDLYQTTDGGENWQLRKTVFWDGQFSFVDMQNAWAVARSVDDEIALVVTGDGAETWQIIEPVVE